MKKIPIETIHQDAWFCPAPFYHIYADMFGNYKPCCTAHSSPYTMNDMGIVEWYTSDVMEDLRQAMLAPRDDSKLSLCKSCIEYERDYGHSRRLEYLNRYTGYWPRDDRIDIEMKIFGSSCNMDCYTCHPVDSTGRQKSLNRINLVDVTRKQQYYPLIVDEIATMGARLGEIKIIGGEPMIMTKQYELLDRLVEAGHSDEIELVYQTSMNTLGNSKYSILNYISKFKKVTFQVSIDGVDEYNTIIRRGSQWQDMVSNIKIVREYPNVKVHCLSTISFLSVLRYDQLVDWLKDNDIRPNYYIINNPTFLMIDHLPDEIKLELMDTYADYPDIVNALKKPRSINAFNKAMKYIVDMDSLYGTDTLKVFPELAPYYDAKQCNEIKNNYWP